MVMKNPGESGGVHLSNIVLTSLVSYVDVDPIQIQQYYEKQVTLWGGHMQEREGKRRRLRR
jgi:hypothetical protein